MHSSDNVSEVGDIKWNDDRECMSAVEFMKKSLEVLGQRMKNIEKKTRETKKIVDSQASKIRTGITDATHTFVNDYVVSPNFEQELLNTK